MRRYFWRGLWTWLPLGLTVYAAMWLIGTVDNYLGPLTAVMVKKVVPEFLLQGWCESGHIPGLSLVLTFLFFVLLGWVATWYVGQRVVALVDWVATRIPLLKVVYSTFRSIGKNAERTGEGQTAGLGKVVRVKEAGYQVLALVTNKILLDDNGTQREFYTGVTPFFPSSARPILGAVDEAIPTVMTPGQLAEFVASLGTVVPQEWRVVIEANNAVAAAAVAAGDLMSVAPVQPA